MSNPFFKFKNFTIYHDCCAMKVGTDGVLLGAWATIKNADSILDVGTGTGLIAIMLAQRNNMAKIDAIDIDKDACKQATKNKENSPYSKQINVECESFLEYFTDKKYDLIVSNPPYFTRSLKCPTEKRSIARHSDSLPLKSLIEHALTMLSDIGRIALILPEQLSTELDFIIATHCLHVIKRTDVISVEGLLPKRFLIELSTKSTNNQEKNTLILETKEHKRTVEYTELTNDFYL